MPLKCETGFILPNGMFIPNTGNGHPGTARFLCKNELANTQFSIDMDNSTYPVEDALVMAGAIALETRRQRNGEIKNCIRSCEKNFLTPEVKKAVEFLVNIGYELMQGWKYNNVWANNLIDALNECSHKLKFSLWQEESEKD